MISPGQRSTGRARLRVAAFVAAAALSATACSSGDSAVDPPAAGSAEVGAALLAGQFDTVGGGTVDLASLQGQDVVFWFWAPW